jgi:L-seryl-tRNA(Ser) seleniumtransferase
MARALRLDKLSLAALDWTLGIHLAGRAESEIPVLQQLRAPLAGLEERARRLAKRLAKVAGRDANVSPRPETALVGGGSLPGFELPGWVVAVSPRVGAGAERIAAGLRAAMPPVVARIRGDELLFDVRTLLDDDEAAVEQALREALRPARG